METGRIGPRPQYDRFAICARFSESRSSCCAIATRWDSSIGSRCDASFAISARRAKSCASPVRRSAGSVSMNVSTNISSACTRAAKSMPSSFGDGFLCESGNHSRRELGAQSVQNPTAFHIPAQAGFVLLAAEPTEDIHHGVFAGFVKGAQGDVLGLGEKGFGFSHFSSLMDVSK